MTTLTPTAVRLLAPVETVLAAMSDRHGPASTHGLAPGLIPGGAYGDWVPAAKLISGERLGPMLDAAMQRWSAAPPAAAALAWKSYTYWLALPTVLGWAAARRVPLLHPDDVLVHYADHQPFLTVGLRRVRVAVLPADPLAATGGPDVTVVASGAELLATLRSTLRGGHLDPLLARIQTRVRLGTRTLLGSLASGVAHGIIRAADALPGAVPETVATLLTALDVADLVSLEPTGGSYAVRRHTCCLAFTLPEPKICSGCCLSPPDRSPWVDRTATRG